MSQLLRYLFASSNHSNTLITFLVLFNERFSLHAKKSHEFVACLFLTLILIKSPKCENSFIWLYSGSKTGKCSLMMSKSLLLHQKVCRLKEPLLIFLPVSTLSLLHMLFHLMMWQRVKIQINQMVNTVIFKERQRMMRRQPRVWRHFCRRSPKKSP